MTSVRSTAIAAVVIAAASVSMSAQRLAPPNRALTTALRVQEPIHADGLLDEPAWSRAIPIGPLRQSDPLEGADATERTDVRVVYDADMLYIGVICYDRSPDDIIATQLKRDAELWMDDSITVVLDPFFNHRDGFFFQMNPSGARIDGQVVNNDDELSSDWDGIWHGAARITTEGWQAEMAIPFKTLRFAPGRTTWGFNVERQIKRRNETDRWVAPRRNSWISNLAQAGELTGLSGINQGLGIDIRPYASGGAQNGDGRFNAGLDVVDSITPNLTGSVTVNTDFAETESDTRQVNLTRFPLFFPEKRSFFLEGAGVFDIAGAGGRDLRPFFSRRIGLLDGVEVPIGAGAKLIGRLSDYNIGVIDVGTRRLSDPGLSGGSVDAQNLLAVRVSRNLFEQSSAGVLVTHGDPSGAGSNTMYGADARFATSSFRGNNNLALELFGLLSDDGVTQTRDGAGGVRIDYPNDRWEMSASWKQIGRHFRPALGFVPRTAIRTTDVDVAFQPRPEKWGIRQLFFELRPNYVTNLDNRVENWRLFTAPVKLEMDSGDRFEWNVAPEFERLDAPFDISDGIVVPDGSYRWTRYGTRLDSAGKRRWVVDASWNWGGFYRGTRRDIELGLTIKANTHISIEARTERNDIHLPAGSFHTQTVTLRGDYNFSPDVSWATLVQYDNQSRIAGLQSRFRWIIEPGSDLFLVINRGWFRSFDGRYLPSYDKASAKLQYTFRL